MIPGLRQRLLSTAIYLPIVAALIWMGSWTFVLLLSLIVFASGIELYAILNRLGWSTPPFLPGAALALFAVSVAGWFGPFLPIALAIPWAFALLFLLRPRTPAGIATGPASWVVHLLGAAYLGILLGLLARVDANSSGFPDAGSRRVFYVLFVTFACDTGAYGFGNLFGRRKLWPSVSPGKTWEGAIGGLVAAVAVGAALAPWLSGGLRAPQGALLGLLTGIAAEVGDLIESRLKRKAAVKDSGHLIPGHGGLLDRLDSLLFSMPLFYYGLNGLVR